MEILDKIDSKVSEKIRIADKGRLTKYLPLLQISTTYELLRLDENNSNFKILTYLFDGGLIKLC